MIQDCPCGSKKTFQECCERFISGQLFPVTPEELMRSRYTAYAVSNMDYIIRTMKPPAADHFRAENTTTDTQHYPWVKLHIIRSEHNNTDGTVEFQAYYLNANTLCVLHEISQFRRDDGIWYYIDGTMPETQNPVKKISRNDLCVCGSEKKFKKCCGKS